VNSSFERSPKLSKKNETKYISHFSSQKSSTKELVIPCKGNKFTSKNNIKYVADKISYFAGTTEDQLAAQEIIDECHTLESNNLRNLETEAIDNEMVIRMYHNKNKGNIHEEIDNMQNMSQLDDYEKVPIQGFGMAMLRGMGFKKNQGIGYSKKIVKCIEPQIRPRGLGLGAAVSTNHSSLKESNEIKGREMIKGLRVELKQDCIETADCKMSMILVGTVEGIDVENARVIVKLDHDNSLKSVSINKVKKQSKHKGLIHH